MAILNGIGCLWLRAKRDGRPGQEWRAWLFRLLGMAVVLSAGHLGSLAEESAPSEPQIKAAFLINFPKYADWPEEAFAAMDSPIVIVVLGESQVAGEIEKVIAGRKVNNREIILKHWAADEELGVCHILFIAGTEQKNLSKVLAQIKESSILTVGESDGFLENGGIINLVRSNRRIALEVNLDAANNARIKISSKLLSVARAVTGKTK